jgi:hypothetical protein
MQDPPQQRFGLALDFFNQHFLRAQASIPAGNRIPARPKDTSNPACAQVTA